VTILLLLVVQQVFILFRTAQRVAAWGSALEIYDALWPPHHLPFEPELVPALVVDGPRELTAGAEATPEPQDGEGSDF